MRPSHAMRRLNCALPFAAALASAWPARAEFPPLPPERPGGIGAAIRSTSPAAGYCLALLARQGIEAVSVAPAPPERPGCAIGEPVRLVSIGVPGKGGRIRLPDRPLLGCAFASVYSEWLAAVAAPLLAGHFGSELVEIRTGPGHECRNVNRKASGKLSAHATGEAIDMDRFRLADGRELIVGAKDGGSEQAALAALRKTGCGWFTTVLGPGSDAAHAKHIHFDLMRHGRSGAMRICD